MVSTHRCFEGKFHLYFLTGNEFTKCVTDTYLYFSVVVWDIAKKEAICGHQAQVESAGITYCVAFSNRSDDVFVTGGE